MNGHFLPESSEKIESVVICLIDASKSSGIEYAHRIRSAVIEKFCMRENNVKIIAATTKNTANMLTTAAELRIKHMPCYVHSVHLFVDDILYGEQMENLFEYVYNA